MPTDVLGAAALGAVLGLAVVFFGYLLKPLATHWGERLVPRKTEEARIEARVSAAQASVVNGSVHELSREVVKTVFDEVRPFILRVGEAVFWSAYGLSIIVGASFMIAGLLVAFWVGGNVLFVGIGIATSLIGAGVIEMWVGKRKFKAA